LKGSIMPRGSDSWRIRIYTGLGADGKQQQRSFTVKGGRKDAEKALRRTLSQVDSGAYREPVKLTVAVYMQDWLETTAKMAVNSKTLDRYKEIIEKDLIPNLGKIELQKLTAADIRKYYAWASENGRKRVGKDGNAGLSKTTLLQYHRILHKAMERAVEDELINANPVKRSIAPVPDDDETIHVISPDEARYLLSVANTGKYRDCIEFALQTGMRRGEILAAKWSDCDFDKRILRIPRSLSQVRSAVSEKSTKTRSGRRTIKLMKASVELLMRIQEKQAQNKAFLEDAYSNKNYIFAETDGEPYMPESLTHSFIHYRDKAKMEITFHDLRHTHASWLLAANIHPKVVSERLGHSSIQITLDLYSHLLPHIQDDAVRQLEEMLGSTDDLFGDIPDDIFGDTPDTE